MSAKQQLQEDRVFAVVLNFLRQVVGVLSTSLCACTQVLLESQCRARLHQLAHCLAALGQQVFRLLPVLLRQGLLLVLDGQLAFLLSHLFRRCAHWRSMVTLEKMLDSCCALSWLMPEVPLMVPLVLVASVVEWRMLTQLQKTRPSSRATSTSFLRTASRRASSDRRNLLWNKDLGRPLFSRTNLLLVARPMLVRRLVLSVARESLPVASHAG